MASRGSHKWCSKCHKRWVDKRAAHGMCKVCRDLHTAQLRRSRSEVKERRAARRTAQNGVVMSEGPDPIAAPEMGAEVVAAEFNVGSIPEPPRHKGGRGTGLTQEQRSEVVSLYVTTDQPLREIARAYGFRDTYTFYLLKQAGITWRRGDGSPPPSLEPSNGVVKPDIVETLPEPVEKALERMVTQPHEQARPEQLRSTPPIETGLVPTPPTVRQAASLPEYVDEVLPGERTWQVEYLGSMLVKGRSVDEALERARADGHLREIIGVTLRTR